MLNIGFTEFLAIGVVALLVIGPKQLPEVARIVGRLMGELKKASQDLSGGLLEVTREMKDSINETTQQIMNEGQKIADSVTQDEDYHSKDHHAEDHPVEVVLDYPENNPDALESEEKPDGKPDGKS